MELQLNQVQLNRIQAEVDASATTGNYASAYGALRDVLRPNATLRDALGINLPIPFAEGFSTPPDHSLEALDLWLKVAEATNSSGQNGGAVGNVIDKALRNMTEGLCQAHGVEFKN